MVKEAEKTDLEKRQVPVSNLTATLGCETLNFKDTSELEPLKGGIVGQERAVRAMDFGLRIKHFGYNIYLSGPTGTGKTTYAAAKVKEIAKGEPTPGDICYVYNFEQPDFPQVLEFNAGEAAVFKKEMEELIEDLKTEIKKSFESEEYEARHTQIRRKWETQINTLWYGMENAAMRKGFSVQKTPTGIFTVPLDAEGKTIPREEFLQLPEATQARINSVAQEVQAEINDALRKIRGMEKEMRKELANMERETGLYSAGYLVNQMKEEYKEYPKVGEYLDDVLEDIINNLEDFLMDADEVESQQLVLAPKPDPSQKLNKYKVNVFVDNGKTEGAPVVIEDNPTYYNLLGRVDYKSSYGVMVTDFSMIKAGAIHRANGGYLILQVADLFSSGVIWPAFKRALKTGQARIENIGEHVSMVSLVTLKPQPIDINVKVILIGSPNLFNQLYFLDDDFKKLFKVKVDFDYVMPRQEKQLKDYTSFVCSFCNDSGNRHLDCDAVSRLLEYGSRLVSHQQKLTTRFNEIVNIIVEGNYWAAQNNHPVVTEEDICRALEEKVYRSNLIEEKIQESIKDDSIVLSLEGFAVGQVNGLAVMQVGEYAFGKPSRITARTSLGQKGIINIEREVEISGPSHSKGILVLSGYLAGRFGKNKPFSLNASITFEQLYDGVDGDSASSAELYALLSDLSGVPLNQGIAVTGSVNQYGEIQPIGGVNEKIEGFYHACKNRGLTGNQGVMIPKRNVKNLILKREVVKAVEEGKFRIWAVETIDEGIEILSGVAAGEMYPDGTYPEGTINGLVDLRIREMAEAIRKFGKKDNLVDNEAAVSQE
jgi:lon-related putative ATP-dependent protease